MIKDSYKQTRHEDDLNQPLSVQPWGLDDDKRKYWLIEGQDDTSFRLYREGNRALKNIPWRSVAGTIDEVKAVAETLENKHHSQASRRLASRIHAAVPRFEATEEVRIIPHPLLPCLTLLTWHTQKRRRREYRQIRRQQFARPEPGFSLYEGRTRGKRARYTFDDNDDEDDFESDALSVRRSTRQRSDRSTPVDAGPTVTASGRTVRPRGGGMYGETLLSGQTTGLETGSYAASENSESLNEQGRATRASRRSGGAVNLNGNRKRKLDTYNSYDEMSDESDADQSGDQWDGGDDDDDKDNIEESDDDDMSVDEEEDTVGGRRNSLIVKLKVGNRVKDDTSALDDLPTIKSSQGIPELERKPPMTTEEPTGNLHNPAHVNSEKPEEAAPNPKPEPMDIDPPHAKPLEHPSSLDLPINGHSEHPAPASSATNTWPLPKEQNLPQQTEVPAQVQVQQVHANGWS